MKKIGFLKLPIFLKIPIFSLLKVYLKKKTFLEFTWVFSVFKPQKNPAGFFGLSFLCQPWFVHLKDQYAYLTKNKHK